MYNFFINYNIFFLRRQKISFFVGIDELKFVFFRYKVNFIEDLVLQMWFESMLLNKSLGKL